MTSKPAAKPSLIIHPYFFAIYSVVGVFSSNVNEIAVEWVVRPTIILLILTAILFWILRKRIPDVEYAGLVTTLGLFWFFFGHIHRFLSENSSFWNTPPGTAAAFLLWTIPLMLIGSPWAWRKVTNRTFITQFLNYTSIIVILFPLYITGRTYVRSVTWSRRFEEKVSQSLPITLKTQAVQPDIYLIILDAYGREDFLREEYGFDNSKFVGDLRERGFYVADQSSPNYPMTSLSISSLLNVNYLDEYTRGLEQEISHELIYDYLQHSSVRQAIQDLGYQFVAVQGSTSFTQMRDADVYYKMTIGDVNGFEGLLLSSTVANLTRDAWDQYVPMPGYSRHRRQILFSLDTLESIPSVQGPKFVFAHITAPHLPFVIDEYGNLIQSDRPYSLLDTSTYNGTTKEYMAKYAGEVLYLNRRMIEIIDKILEDAERPPIIIIQGDHGPGLYFNMLETKNSCLKERYSILNAYYFPDGDYSALYPSVTPVNSFRIIFNQYFGAQLPLLEDRNYYSTWYAPYQYMDVTDRAQTCHLASNQ